MTTVFLLSPAYCGGRRAAILLRPGSQVPIARACQSGALTLGDAFAFMSGLYFRGKLTYARAFGRAGGPGIAPALIITPTRGLLPLDAPAPADLIREFATVDVAIENARYREPLERDVDALARATGDDARVVLLGSVATGKYVDVLAPLLGDRLRYPSAFVGRGDMSRGGLLLRSAESGVELDYEILRAGVRPRGARPPKLPPKPLVVRRLRLT
jgi:hypothetical protein